MPKSTKVTKKQAEAVLIKIKEQFHVYLGCEGDGIAQPQLIMDFDFFGYGGVPTIVWEEGPYYWAVNAFSEHRDEEFGFTIQGADKVPGVWTEPTTGWALAIISDNA